LAKVSDMYVVALSQTQKIKKDEKVDSTQVEVCLPPGAGNGFICFGNI
jgi:hypothetical protein